jgi:transposase
MYMTPQACREAGVAYPAYRLFVGFDVGKTFHVAHARLAGGGRVLTLRVGNDEAAVDSFLARCLERSGCDASEALVVVDQRRNIGTVVIRRARAAGMEVAYITGKREKKARELFPGVAKNDRKDAEVIAAAADGMPEALLPVPREDDGLEGARRLRSQLAFATKQATQCRNRVRAALVESNVAFERALDLSRPWALDVLERIGGPWQVLDAGRARLRRVAAGARPAELDALWDSLSGATRPTEEQVRSEAVTFPMLARRIRALDADADELSALVAEEVGDDETYECLLTVPGVGAATAAQLVASVSIESFRGSDRLASYCGLAPRDTQSGTTISSVSASPEGNRCLKNLLIFSCLSLVRGDSEFGRYYRACRARGMRHTPALKATARKRLKVIYAVMRDRRPYVPA